MNIAQSLLHALRDRGAGELFGIPGDFALPFFKIAEESGILPLHTLSHEPAVGFAADAAARFRGSLGVGVVTYGAGAFNMVNAVAGAYAEKSPVVVISGAPGTQEGRSGLLLHHQGRTLDTQYRVYQEITCAQTRLDDAATAPGEIARVLGAAIEQARPAYIEIPRDMVGVACEPVPPHLPPEGDPDAIAACADEVMVRLRAANRPVLLIDVEVRRFGLEASVADLARRLAIPVVTTFMGRGLLSRVDAPLAGTYLGVAGDPALTDLVEDSDGLLLLGVILCDTNFGVSAGKLDLRRTIQASDGQVTLGYHSYPDIPLRQLVQALLARATALGDAAPAPEPSYPRGLPADTQPINPSDIARGINDLFHRHGAMPLAADMGDCLFTAMDIEDAGVVAPGYYAGMGFGVPAGIGAQIATGRRTLILVGDGAFQMTGWRGTRSRRRAHSPGSSPTAPRWCSRRSWASSRVPARCSSTVRVASTRSSVSSSARRSRRRRRRPRPRTRRPRAQRGAAPPAQPVVAP